MTVKEAFLNYDYIVAPLPLAQRGAAENWLGNQFPNDYVKTLPTGLETIAFKPSSFRFFIGFEYNDIDESMLWVNNLTKFQNGLLAIKQRRIVLPVVNQEARSDISFYAWNGNVHVPGFGTILNADFINLATFVRNDADPEL